MELSKNFEHQAAEQKWYSHWLAKGYFNSTPDERPAYTVVIPPPNVTGILHMGHCLNNTIQDVLVRRAAMQGYNTCWVPGTDHASIATEAKVVQMLRERGIAKSSLSRAEFLEYAWEWKEKYGGIILEQLKKMGCRLDWNRTSFTMDKDYADSVINVFIDLYNKGYIYRGKRMINWDPQAKTALSDEEVISKETQSKFYHLKYFITEDGQTPTADFITIATVRPETILGDTAVCVNPADDRYKHFIGKKVLVPLINRAIPIIADDYVAMDFGTGALKITPAHDKNDFVLGQKHGLEVIDIMNDDGTFSEAATLYIGQDRFAVRKAIVPDLEAAGCLVKIEDYTNQVGYSERSNAVVEPRLSLQWWVSMKELSQPALDAVMDGEIDFIPAKFKNLYQHWMEGVKDWCISRQLWWGHRIPAWYDGEGNYVVAATAETAAAAYAEKFGKAPAQPLQQDEDCLDTWFSSWLWPFEVFKGLSNPGNADAQYYYPTATLVTAPEIIFFWVARMIIAGKEYMKDIPFKQVYFTGIVRDEQGRKMSKQLGNSPDLLELIDLNGADAVRFGILISSPAGNDLLFHKKSIEEQGRNFINKIWNALKLVKMWEAKQSAGAPVNDSRFATVWMQQRLQEVKAEVEQLMQQFKLSEALKTIYSLVWDDFCSWYLEWVKPGFEQPIATETYQQTVSFFTELLQLLHPYMPFVTEEIYHLLAVRTTDLCQLQLTAAGEPDKAVLAQGNLLKDVITALRDARNKNQLKPKDAISLHIETATTAQYEGLLPILARQVNAKSTVFTMAAIAGAIGVVVGKEQFYIESDQPIDTAAQKDSLQKELAHLQGFLVSVEKKLGNERFVQNAKPEVIALEQKKKSDAEAKIQVVEAALAQLG